MMPEGDASVGQASTQAAAAYPVRLRMAFDPALSRWKTALRLPLLLPSYVLISVVASLLPVVLFSARAGTLLRRKHPDWLFGFSAGFVALVARFQAYACLLTDAQPSLSQEVSGPVIFGCDPIPPGKASRWRGIAWRLVLCVPHFIVLSALGWAQGAVTVLAWFAILFTGRYPEGLFEFSAGVIRWQTRVLAYMLLLTDDFPPYALADETPKASRRAAIASGVPGLIVVGGFAALVAAGMIAGPDPAYVDVDYAALEAGRRTSVLRFDGGQETLTLVRIHDPGGAVVPAVTPGPGERVVAFQWRMLNQSGSAAAIGDGFTLTYREGARESSIGAALITVHAERTPGEEESIAIVSAFVVPIGSEPIRLRVAYSTLGFLPLGGLEYRFE